MRFKIIAARLMIWFLAVFGGMDSAPAVSPALRTISISSAVGKMTQALPAAAGDLN